jgi:hypothetical protein
MRLFIGLFFFVFLLQSCKKSGCTNPLASNFDKKADFENNTCTFLSDPYKGSWMGNETCASGSQSEYEVVIEQHPTEKNKVVINYFSFFSLEIIADFNENTLTIPEQTASSPFSTYTLQGSGQLNGTTLTINYSINSSSVQEICQLILNKN